MSTQDSTAGNECSRCGNAWRRVRLKPRILRRELEETNQGVVALYAELDDRAAQLREAVDLKSRFLSYMSHEFRTPLDLDTESHRHPADRTGWAADGRTGNPDHAGSPLRRRAHRNGR